LGHTKRNKKAKNNMRRRRNKKEIRAIKCGAQQQTFSSGEEILSLISGAR
jgi:hypothetical protein